MNNLDSASTDQPVQELIDVETAAKVIYDNLNREKFTTEDQIRVIKRVRNLISATLDQQIADLQRVKDSL